MNGLDLSQLKHEIVAPALAAIRFSSPDAISLVTGTALAESRGVYVKQLGTGPALSLWQMEPATHEDIWTNFLAYRADLRGRVSALLSSSGRLRNLLSNLDYGAAMCRVHYLRSPLAIPSTAEGMAALHKSHYNSALGAANASENVALFALAISA